MTLAIQKVQPGDLITAQFFNGLIDVLAALDGRVATLEGGITGPMRIISPLPSDRIAMSDELRIFGEGFGVPSLATVTIDDSHQVTTFKGGSSDKLLILDIPPFQVPDGGKLVNLTVSNARGAATTKFTLLPPVQRLPTGSLGITFAGGPATIQQPAADFRFSVTADTTADETYTVSARLDNAPQEWSAFLTDPNLTRIAPPEVRIPKQTTVPIQIRVLIPIAGSGTLFVTVTSKLNPDSLSQSQSIPVAVGGTVTPDPISVQFDAFSNERTGNGKLSAGAIVIPAGIETTISYFVTVTEAGNYTVAAPAFTTTNPQWTARVGPPGPARPNVQPGQFEVKAVLTPPANAPPSTLTMRVTKDGAEQTMFGRSILPIRIG
jgi:hypothetical protein